MISNPKTLILGRKHSFQGKNAIFKAKNKDFKLQGVIFNKIQGISMEFDKKKYFISKNLCFYHQKTTFSV